MEKLSLLYGIYHPNAKGIIYILLSPAFVSHIVRVPVSSYGVWLGMKLGAILNSGKLLMKPAQIHSSLIYACSRPFTKSASESPAPLIISDHYVAAVWARESARARAARTCPPYCRAEPRPLTNQYVTMAAVTHGLWVKLFVLLHRIWQSLLSASSKEETLWKQVPTGTVEPLLQGLRPATQKTYIGVLKEFEGFAQSKHLRLDTRRDVDEAAYTFVLEHTRSRGENLIAALHRCYPPLKGHLVWSSARLRALSLTAPPTHHTPMDWLVAVAIAHAMVQRGRPRHGAVLLLQWRCGLRPSECLGLRGRDLHDATTSYIQHQLSYLRVGALRGTKAGRPQIVRAWWGDWEANFLIHILKKATPYEAPLSSLSSVAQLQTVITQGSKDAKISLRFTPHCPRAG